jgi:hypothetical protein
MNIIKNGTTFNRTKYDKQDQQGKAAFSALVVGQVVSLCKINVLIFDTY